MSFNLGFVLLALVFRLEACDLSEMRVLVSDLQDRASFERFTDDVVCARQVIPLLIEQLKPIDKEVISIHEIESGIDGLRVIWSLRALRFLTGQKFFGNPADGFREQSDTIRADILSKSRGLDEIPFFAVWLSRDSIFIADINAQMEVINRWHVWLESEFPEGSFPSTNPAIDFWYF